jgi:Holliday junction resolvase RusA-like endonuclease
MRLHLSKIVPKARPRFSKGHCYLPKNYREWKAEAVVELREQWQGPPLSRAHVTIELPKQRGDLDNIAGAVLDAMTEAGIIADDRMSCVEALSIKKTEGRINIQVSTSFGLGED